MTLLGCMPGQTVGKDIDHLVGAEAPPLKASLGDIAPIFSQRGQTCFGNAWRGAIWTQSAGAINASSHAIWGLAVELEHEDLDVSKPLPDEGVYGHRVIEVLRDIGVVSFGRWPDTMGNARVPQDVIEAGRIATLVDVHGIEETGAALKSRIMQTIGLAKQAVVFGQEVRESYENITSQEAFRGYKGDSGKALGGHAQYIDSYDQGGVWIVGSWGRSFGIGGMVYVPWDVFLGMNTYNFQTATFLPEKTR